MVIKHNYKPDLFRGLGSQEQSIGGDIMKKIAEFAKTTLIGGDLPPLKSVQGVLMLPRTQNGLHTLCKQPASSG